MKLLMNLIIINNYIYSVILIIMKGIIFHMKYGDIDKNIVSVVEKVGDIKK